MSDAENEVDKCWKEAEVDTLQVAEEVDDYDSVVQPVLTVLNSRFVV